jgi:ubiquinone/menaquinone biosynthesis C-methylase UbiE
MMNQRIAWKNMQATARARQGDARDMPFDDAAFDYAVSIGCLHHTGDIHRCIREVHRILRPGGQATIMLYRKYSLRMLVLTRVAYLVDKWLKSGRKYKDYHEFVKSIYDSDTRGNAAPVTQFSSRRDIERYFSLFSRVKIATENIDDIVLPRTRLGLPRKMALNNIARLVGTDFYVTAIK